MVFHNQNENKRNLDDIVKKLTTKNESANSDSKTLENSTDDVQDIQMIDSNKKQNIMEEETDVMGDQEMTQGSVNSNVDNEKIRDLIRSVIETNFTPEQIRHQSSEQFSIESSSMEREPNFHSESQQMSNMIEGNNTKVTNVYRGLYPIKNVKKYFKKKTVDNRKLYECQWPDCSFKTWKYSQHISRHIYLKHIGIKELRCDVENCEKVFKRPESLVQHVKNHICGFGIDNIRMKDPNNKCGVKNIKKHFIRIMDNDIQVFKCQFDNCDFVTNNSGSIRRHVHNQHICPHSNPANASNGNNHSTSTTSIEMIHNTNDRHSVTTDEESSNAINPLVLLTEYENQIYDPVNGQINIQTTNIGIGYDVGSNAGSESDESPLDLTGLSIPSALNRIDDDEEEEEDEDEDDDNDDENEMDDDLNRYRNGSSIVNDSQTVNSSIGNNVDQQIISESSNTSDNDTTPKKNNGLYSLKNHKGRYYKAKTAEGVLFICKKCEFQAKSQITLIRHLWNERGYKEFSCEFDGCELTFENEFSRYKHRKFDHGQPNQPSSVQAIEPSANNTNAMIVNQEMNNIEQQILHPPLPRTATPPNDVESKMEQSSILHMNNNHNSSNLMSSSAYQTINNFMANQSAILGSLIPVPRLIPSPSQPPTHNNISNSNHHIGAGLSRIQPLMHQLAQMTECSPRRMSNGSQSSLTDTTPNMVNSSLISILQAPSVTSNTMPPNQNRIHLGITNVSPTRSPASGPQFYNEVHGFHTPTSTYLNSSSILNGNRINLKTDIDHSTLIGEGEVTRTETPSNQSSGNEQELEDEIDGQSWLNQEHNKFESMNIDQHVNQPLDKSIVSSGTIRKYNCRSKSGLYSLKKHENDYVRDKSSDGYHYRCTNCPDYTTKSQASMVRHIWTHKKQNFRCDCGEIFENEFSLYKHKKNTHPELTTQHNRSNSKKEKKEATNQGKFANDKSKTMQTFPPTSAQLLPMYEKQQHSCQLPNSFENNLIDEQLVQPVNSMLDQLKFMQLIYQLKNSTNSDSNVPFLNQEQLIKNNSFQFWKNDIFGLNSRENNEDVRNNMEIETTNDQEQESIEGESKGMSRRALHFKSHKNKPVHIRQGSDTIDYEMHLNQYNKTNHSDNNQDYDEDEKKLEIDI